MLTRSRSVRSGANGQYAEIQEGEPCGPSWPVPGVTTAGGGQPSASVGPTGLDEFPVHDRRAAVQAEADCRSRDGLCLGKPDVVRAQRGRPGRGVPDSMVTP